MKNAQTKLTALRAVMKDRGIDALIVPNCDPHFSEYTAQHWKCLRWVSGFTGSAATLVVTAHKAALWTDGRYFIQAEQELSGSGIELMKLRVEGTENIEAWLVKRLARGAQVGVDGKLFTVQQFAQMEEQLIGLNLTAIDDPFAEIWHDRPHLSHHKAFLLPDELTGCCRTEKLKTVVNSAELSNKLYMITALDELAWLLNLRGADVKCNPVALAYAVIEYPKVHLFIALDQLDKQAKEALEADGVLLHNYEQFDEFLSTLDAGRCARINPNKLSIHHYQLLSAKQIDIKYEADPFGVITSLKASKNETELEGFRKAMRADGVALLRFWKWLEGNIGAALISEVSVAKKLHRLRELDPDFVGDSFPSIAAYGANGASPHYSPRVGQCSNLAPDAFFLLDSGGHYYYGTTDITRTVHLGTPTAEEKEDYTLVLKGMIALSRAKFLAGTRGAQLDVLARQHLWAHGKNYLHGTGHGVGHFLNVHEGPQSIRMEDNGVSMKPGMVISNEPAIYQPGKYGVRTENLLACKLSTCTEFGTFYEFETLTMYPIDTKAIEVQLMTADELDWLNNYHQQVFAALSPLLNDDERLYLNAKTRKIQL